MIEMFTKWVVSDCDAVTENNDELLRDSCSDINDVTVVTSVTLKGEEPEKSSGVGGGAEKLSSCSKNSVTAVTVVTQPILLEKTVTEGKMRLLRLLKIRNHCQ